MPIVRFSKAFTTKLWHCPRTREEIKNILEKRKGKGETETRIKLTELNKNSFEQLSPKCLISLIQIQKKFIPEHNQYHGSIA